MPKVKVKDRYVSLACEQCRRRNYYKNKSVGKKSGLKPAPLALMKFCRWCRRHTAHKEVKS